MTAAAVLEEQSAWTLPAQAAALFAVDPVGLSGLVLRARPGPVRDHWLAQLQQLLPEGTPWRRMPAHIGDDRLLGGLDLSATLRSGRPVPEKGLLAECNGGVLLIAMAERLDPGVAAKLAAVLDSGIVALERGGVSQRIPTRLGMIALDEGIEEDERIPVALADRFAIHLDLEALSMQQLGPAVADRPMISSARDRLSDSRIDDPLVEVLCRAALSFGIESLRAVLLAIRASRAAAVLDERTEVTDADVALAAQLVYGCRAQCLPETNQDSEQEAPPPPDSDQAEGQAAEPPREPGEQEEEEQSADPKTLDDRVLEAAQAAIPPQLLQQLRYAKSPRGGTRSSARSAARRRPARRGRRLGSRPGEPVNGARLNLVDTLRVAAPWQPLRRREAVADAGVGPAIKLRREDFRINRYQQRAATTTVFAVDASGSAALHRLAEAKGAVELLLAESYQRRDQVALVAFRGRSAELLLPPTRSLVRAKRSLAALPGGGGTPLAAGIRLAFETALSILHRGETPVIILLTDGRANIALDGEADRPQATSEALDAARAIRLEEITALLVDTSPRPRATARELADAMGATYLALPQADAHKLTGAARAVMSETVQR